MRRRVSVLLLGSALALAALACGGGDSNGGGEQTSMAGSSASIDAGVGGSAGNSLSNGAGSGGDGGSGGTETGAAGTGGSGGDSNVGGMGGSVGGDGGMGGSVTGVAGTGGAPSHRFSIRFDYRFDTLGFFADPERRVALDAAGDMWSSVIHDDFPSVPMGTSIRLRNPENRDEYLVVDSIEEDIDDLLVFVGTSEAIPGLGRGGPSGTAQTGDALLDAGLIMRRDGSDFEPWAGSISFKASSNFYFDQTPDTSDDIPFEAFDFTSTAAHELGHVMGFSSCPAFDAFISGETFIGPATQAAYGGPAPLMPDFGHFVSHTQSDGVDTLMDPGQANGLRFITTTLDRAVFRDLGYQIDE